MKAFALMAPERPPEIVDLPVPEPEPGEIRVRVIAASVNGFDVAASMGAMAPFFEYRYPVILGREFAGVVDALGEGTVGFAVGDAVFGVVSKRFLREGAFAEHTTVSAADGARHAPGRIDVAEAASLGHTGTTALTILDALGVDVAGRTVLVVGATGGVGTLLVQLAARAGAAVIATGRTPAGRETLIDLGATATIDYTRGLEPELTRIGRGHVDDAVHLSGDIDEIAGVTAAGGRVISPLVYDPSVFAHPGITLVPIAAYPTGAGLERLVALVDDGLRVIVDRELPFTQIAEALAAWGHESLGNLVVMIDA
jgi:NADPH2:quinone reductase